LGVLVQTIKAYNSLQNSKVEQSIRTTKERIRAMIQGSRMLVKLQNHALKYQAA